MCSFRSVIVVAISAVLAWMLATYPDPSLGLLRAAAAGSAPPRVADVVERARKSDRAGVRQDVRVQKRTIAKVEIVGLRDPAIIYRDREGRVLFQTDPTSNVTVIAKGIVLPQITVQETSRSAPRPLVPVADNPGEVPLPVLRDKPRTKPIPEGCDPAASPIASPELSHVLSKCLVEAPSSLRLASRE